MTATPRRYPIKDIQFHEEAIRETADLVLSHDEGVAIAWHSTAIAYLQFGAAHGLLGPGVEREVDGQVVPALIEDYLLPAMDSHGLTYFKHVYKEEGDADDQN
jgi:hypothetical protein